MITFLCIILGYLVSVVIAFGLVYWGDYKYRQKCNTLYEFLFETPGEDFMPNIFILFPALGLMYGIIITIIGVINKISDWSKTIKLRK